MTYFLKQKSKAFEKFKLYRSFVETQTGNKLKKLRADGGGEYLNKNFRNYLLENGIQQETTTPHSSAQNRIAEQLNRTLWSMRAQCYISINFLTCFGKKPSLMQHISKIDPRHAHSKITRFRMKYFGGRNWMYLIWKNLAKSVGSCSRTKKFQNWTQNQKTIFCCRHRGWDQGIQVL